MCGEAVVIVPFRGKGDRWRHHNLIEVLKHLEKIDIAPVHVVSDGREDGTPFCRSAAYNTGITDHPAAVFIFHEADMLVPRQQLIDAVDAAAAQPGLVVPFLDYHYLSAADTERVYQFGLKPFDCMPEYVMADGRSNGAVNVVSAETMAAVGQWDQSLTGWGYDDRAMVTAFRVATSNPTRYIKGPAVHLYHVPGWSTESRFRGGADIPAHEQAATCANEQRYRKYRCATTAERIRELTAGKP